MDELYYYRLGMKRGGGGGNTPSGGEDWIGDGNTHIWIRLAEGRTSPALAVGVNGAVTVDWGDGTKPDVLTGTSTSILVYTPKHEYAKAGEYIITLSGDGDIVISGPSSVATILNPGQASNDSLRYHYLGAVKKVECGNNVIGIGGHAFRRCEALTQVSMPKKIASLERSVFSECYLLESVNIPNSITTMGIGAFTHCHRISRINVPSGIISIPMYAFQCCYGVTVFDFSNHTVVPSLESTNAFIDIPADCEFRIPTTLYDEWIAATNWSAIAATNTFVGV